MIVDIQVEALDRTYQYRVPKELEQEISTGTPVRIPFGRGNRLMHGFVIGLTETPAFDVSRIKDILGIEKSIYPWRDSFFRLPYFCGNSMAVR